MTFTRLTYENHGRNVQIDVPQLEKSQLQTIISSIKHQQREYLNGRTTSEMVEIIDEVVQKWLNPTYELRQFAEETLPVITGYDEEMIRLFLANYFRKFRKPYLQRMIEEDFTNPLVLDEFRPRRAGGLTRAYGAELIAHIFSGNVPGLPLWGLVSSLLVKSAALGKVSSEEPLFPALFAKSIAEVDPDAAKALAVVWWKGGTVSLEDTLYHNAQVVTAYGADQTMNEISSRLPAHVRFVPHGHKVSFGVLAKEALSSSLAWQSAQRAAKDVSWFDQQGCLSPHVFYVEKDGDFSPKDFTRLLAHEMENFQHKMKSSELTAEEVNAIRRVRTDAEFNKDKEVIASEKGASWTVIHQEQQTAFPLSVLNRVITVVPIDTLSELREKTSDIRQYVQTAGISCPPQKLQQLIYTLGDCGVNRICSIGEMSLPEPGWHHDGRPNLGEFVYWCDVESSVERITELYDPDRD
ncbi:acyl-CoA reductase [Alteribacillus sp. HJP-4]